jgi:hypothetical protein
MAQSILDRLGYNLQDLSLDYGDVVIEDGEISHQLWYSSISSSCNIMGYVYQEHGLYYTSNAMSGNHRTAECAALDLLDREVVEYCRVLIELERAASPDYN